MGLSEQQTTAHRHVVLLPHTKPQPGCPAAPQGHQPRSQLPTKQHPVLPTGWGTYMISLFLRGPPKGTKGRLPVAAW